MRLDVYACALNPSISVPNDVQSATLISIDDISFNKVSYECIYVCMVPDTPGRETFSKNY